MNSKLPPMELTSTRAKEMHRALTDQNFGVSPLDEYQIPTGADKRTPIYTIPGIPRKLLLQMIEVAILEHAMNGEFADLNYQCAKSYMPSITSEQHNKIVNSQEFHTALVLRGVRKETDGLSGDQMLALSAVTDLSAHRSLERRLRELGIPWYQWQTWMHSPLFKAHYERLSKQVFDSAQSSIDLKVASGALDGKLDFIKYYNELTGRHSTERRAHADVQMILNEVVKIIHENVKDPEVLTLMAAQLSAVVAKLG